MKKIIKYVFTLFCLMLSFIFVLPNQAYAASSSIALNKTSVSLTVGTTLKLKASVTGDSSKVTWTSSNSSVASVNSKGKITAKKTGTAVIRAKANGKTAKCTIKVTENRVRQGLYYKEYLQSSDNYTNPRYSVSVLKKTNGKIKFVVEYSGINGSPIYQTNAITAKVSNNKVSGFSWTDSWGNSGTGSLVFKKNKVTVKMNVTSQSSINRWLWGTDSVTLSFKKSMTKSALNNYFSHLY